jgi:hypothetical protein
MVLEAAHQLAIRTAATTVDAVDCLVQTAAVRSRTAGHVLGHW